MVSGEFPVVISIHRILKLSFLLFFHVTSMAQSDTFMLQTFEVKDSIEIKQKRFTTFSFDSSQYSSTMSLDGAELINQNTGIYVKDYGPGTTSTLSYRGGTASQTKLYWDGISVDNSMLGQSDLSLFSFDNQVRMDFFKGGNSLALGSGGFGGILNLQGSSDDWEGYQINTSYSAGSFNTNKIPFNLFIGNGKWKLESNFSYLSSDNNYPYVNYLNKDQLENRENAAFKRYQFMPRLSVKLNKHHELSFAYWYTSSDREVPSPIETNHGNANQKDSWNRIMASWKYCSRQLELTFKSALIDDDMLYENELINVLSDNRVKASKNQVIATYKLSKRISSESQFKYDLTKVISNNYDAEREMKLYGLNESIIYHLNHFYAKANLRLETQTRQDVYVLPSFNFGFLPFNNLPNTWLFSNLSENVRLPSFNELYWQNVGNQDLKAEKSTSIEVGIDQGLKENRHFKMNLQTTIYYNEISNMIVWVPDNSLWRPNNISAVLNKGLEFETKVNYHVSDLNMNFNAGYTYTSSKIIENQQYPELNGNQQLYIPLHKAQATTRISWKSIFINFNQVFVGQVFISSDNNTYLPLSAPANIEVGKKFNLSKAILTAKLAVKNAFNENYQYVAHMPMPMRNFLITLSYQLNQKNHD